MAIIPHKAEKEQFPYRVTMKLRAAFAIGDQPTKEPEKVMWLGYFRFADATTLPHNALTFPSINCFIPYHDRIVPRLGSSLLGAGYTQNWPTIGHMKKYGTMSGIELELRVIKSGGPPGFDIIEAWCPTYVAGVPQSTFEWQQITLNTNPLTPGIHEYYFAQQFDTDLNPAQGLNLPRAIWTNGTTNIYSWSGGIAPIVSIVPNVSISTVTGVTWTSQGFVDPAFDSSLNGTITINGVAYTVTSGWETDTLQLASTVGISVNNVAFSQVQQDTTPINISGTITHGTVTLVPAIGGLAFQKGEQVVGSISGASANITIDRLGPGPMLLYNVISGGTGLFFQPGEIVTGIQSKAYTTVLTYTQTNTNQLAFDVVSVNQNYVYYGSWKSMKLYQSNGFNKPAVSNITNVQAVQNDMVLGTTLYTGSGQNVYRVTIDSVFPIDNTQTYIPAGNSTGFNDARYDTTGYTAPPNYLKPNVYGVNIVGDFYFTATDNGSGFSYQIGETIAGPGIPNSEQAQGIIVSATLSVGTWTIGIKMTTIIGFKAGDLVIGSSSGTTSIIQVNGIHNRNLYNVTKNGVIVLPIAALITTPITLVDGLTITFANEFGHSVGDCFQLSINQGGNDTFKWQVNGANPVQTGVAILPGTGTLIHGAVVGSFFQNEKVSGGTSGATGFVTSDTAGTMILYNTSGIFQTGETITGKQSGATTVVTSYTQSGQTQYLNYGNLQTGLSISFVVNTGHTLGDYWEITATQSVGGNTPTAHNPRAFLNFYYTVPTRMPGEGYIYTLSANFWAMASQENQLYVNNNYGSWEFVTTKVTATIANTQEAISLTPLKQVAASKMIYPYMFNYLDNDLIFVTTDKTLDLIGRMQLIQLPRIDNLSQSVQHDFDEATFIGGSMEYWHKMLWINSPKENVMFCYDNHPENHYWQPPQVIPENGLLSVINQGGADILISHSNIRNQSFSLFTETSGDNLNTYTVRAHTAYRDYGNRWSLKNSNRTFVEGYVTGAPPMNLNVINGIGGCKGVISHLIEPVICTIPDQAPFGEGNLGSHQNGSDIFQQDSHFNEIWYKFKSVLSYRFVALELECTTTNHSYSWLDMDLNMVTSNEGNTDLLNNEVISRV